MKMIKTLAAALMLSLLASSVATAQITPTAPAGDVNKEKLAEMIYLLGMDYTPLKSDDGKVIAYKVFGVRDGKRFPIYLELSPNGSVIWVTANLTEITSAHRADASRLFKLLELNDKIGPCHFFIGGNGRMLVLGLAHNNRNYTVKDLRQQIDRVIDVALKTENEWNADKWGTPAPSPMAIKLPLAEPK